MSINGMRFEITRDMPYSRNESRGRWVDIDSSEEDMTLTPGEKEELSKCCHAIYCGPTIGTQGKVCRVAVYTITGGIIGGAIGSFFAPGIGTASGFGIGLGSGFVVGCIKVACDSV